MTKRNNTALILGGTEPHISLIKSLKRLNYRTILVDYTENPPAKFYADIHERISTLESDLVLSLAIKEDVDLIISTCVDQANVIACHVSEKLNLPHLYCHRAAEQISKKSEMKSAMFELDIPTSKFLVARSASPDVSSLSFPLIVKPSDCTGSKGVVRIEHENELSENVKNALDLSPSGTAIVEEYVEGDEVQVDFFLVEGEPHLLMSRTKVKGAFEKGEFQQSHGSVTPSKLTNKQLQKLKNYARALSKAFELRTTPFFVQAIVNGEDVNIIEFAPRIGGGLSHSLIKLVTGVDVITQSVNAHLGYELDIEVENSSNFFRTGLFYSKGGTLGSIKGVEDCIADGTIELFVAYKEFGQELGAELASRNRVGAFIVKSDSEEGVARLASEALRRIKIYDINDNVINREF
jgi:carbamoylphosphate synthase large subunit